MNYWVRYLAYRHRRRLNRMARAAALCFMAALLFFFIYNIPGTGALSKVLGGRGFSLFDIAVSWGERDPGGLIRSAAPVVAWAGNREDQPEEITPKSLVSAILAPFRISLASPAELLAYGMPALAGFKGGREVPVSSPVAGSARKDPGTRPALTATALLGIYHTHTGETYALTDGTERFAGGKGGVVEVGRAVKDTLENEYGIRVAQDERVNDEIYRLAYVESEKTASSLLEKNRDLVAVLDIHRDAGKSREESLVRVGGKEVAPILFIVGSDARSPFPTWRNNYQFAVDLAGRVNKKFPGLCIGVRVKEGRYNQFLHPRALLVEVGSVSNSTAEAIESAGMLARALAQEIIDLAPGKTQRPGPAAAPTTPGENREENTARGNPEGAGEGI